MALTKIHHKIISLTMGILLMALIISLAVIRLSYAQQAKLRIYEDLDSKFELLAILMNAEKESLRKQSILLSEEPTLKMSIQTGDSTTIQDTASQLQQMIDAELFIVTDNTGKNISQLPTQIPRISTAELSSVNSSLKGVSTSSLWHTNSGLYLVSSQPVSFHNFMEGTVNCALALDEKLATQLGERTNTRLSFIYKGHEVRSSNEITGERLGKVYEMWIGNSSMQILLQVDFSEVIKDLNWISVQLIGLGLGVLLLGLVLSQLLSHSLTRPISRLKESALALGEGEWDTEFQESGSKDELGILEKSFEEMRRSLVSQRDELVEAEAIRKDLELAAKIQRSLLPSKIPRYEGMAMGVRLIPSSHIGGDYYGFSEFVSNYPGIAIADVAGHGAGSALLMAMARTTLLSQAGFHSNTSDLTKALNEILYPELEEAESFLTLFTCSINQKEGTIEYTNAGHNPPLILRANGEIEMLKPSGTAIGFLAEAKYSHRLCPIKPGDVFVLYTDGLIEPTTRNGDLYGLNRLIDVLSKSKSDSVEKILDYLYQDVEDCCGLNEAFKDDRTCVIIKF